MKEILLEIFAEQQIAALPPVRHRSFEFDLVPDTATVLIGVRRCGKTMLMKRRIEQLAEVGVPESQIIYLNFFDERISSIKSSELGLIFEAHSETYPKYERDAPTHIFLDEIQVVGEWESFVSRLVAKHNNLVYLTGSSAKLLSKEVASAMRGRALTHEVFPLSFSEFASWWGIEGKVATADERGKVSAAFGTYMTQGGFPAAYGLHASTRQRLLEDYFRVAIYKDVIERHKANNPHAVDAICRLLINQTSSLYTINRTTSKVKAQGYKVAKDDVVAAISWFEDAYLLESVPIFAESEQRRRVNPRKIYCIDHALASALSFGVSQNVGKRLENIVYFELRRRTRRISYYKSAGGLEVDFCYVADGLVRLIQVSESLRNEAVRERELKAAVAAAKELGIDQATVVTINDNEQIKTDGVSIKVIPAWQFAMSTS